MASEKHEKLLRSKAMRSVEEHAELVEEMRGRLNRIKSETAIAEGEELSKAQHKLAKYGDGVFGKWLSERLEMSRASAYNRIAAFKTFGHLDCPTVRRINA